MCDCLGFPHPMDCFFFREKKKKNMLGELWLLKIHVALKLTLVFACAWFLLASSKVFHCYSLCQVPSFGTGRFYTLRLWLFFE